jgi:hypothetical protein
MRHWIQHHAETRISQEDSSDKVWLCPMILCGGVFNAQLDLLDHLTICPQMRSHSTLHSRAYWCNSHQDFEVEKPFSDCHWDCRRRPLKTNKRLVASNEQWKAIQYKFIKRWPTESMSSSPHAIGRRADGSLACLDCEMEIPSASKYDAPTHTDIARHIIGLSESFVGWKWSRNNDITPHVDPWRASLVCDLAMEDRAITTFLSRLPMTSKEQVVSDFVELLRSHRVPSCEALPPLESQPMDDTWTGIDYDWTEFEKRFRRSYRINASKLFEKFINRDSSGGLDLTKAADISKCRDWIFQDKGVKNELGQMQNKLCNHQSTKDQMEKLKRAIELLKKESGLRQSQVLRVLEQINTKVIVIEGRFRSEQHTAELTKEMQMDFDVMRRKFQHAHQLWGESYPEAKAKQDSDERDWIRSKFQQVLEQLNNLSRTVPDEEQWSNLRTLRSASNVLHRKVLSVLRSSDQTIHHLKNANTIRRLRQQCKGSSEFLNTGILTFRNVLRGSTPSTLKEVLAFVCLSYVMSEVLHSKGNIDRPLEFFEGLSQWRKALKDESERLVFDKITADIWPEVPLSPNSVKPMHVDYRAGMLHQGLVPDIHACDLGDPCTLSCCLQHHLPRITKPDAPFSLLSGTEQSHSQLPDGLDFIVPSNQLSNQSSASKEDENNQLPLDLNEFPYEAFGGSISLDRSLDPFQYSVETLLGQSHELQGFRWSDFLDLQYMSSSSEQSSDTGINNNDTIGLDAGDI